MVYQNYQKVMRSPQKQGRNNSKKYKNGLTQTNLSTRAGSNDLYTRYIDNDIFQNRMLKNEVDILNKQSVYKNDEINYLRQKLADLQNQMESGYEISGRFQSNSNIGQNYSNRIQKGNILQSGNSPQTSKFGQISNIGSRVNS